MLLMLKMQVCLQPVLLDSPSVQGDVESAVATLGAWQAQTRSRSSTQDYEGAKACVDGYKFLLLLLLLLFLVARRYSCYDMHLQAAVRIFAH